MDFAHLHSNNVIIDSKDAKAKVQADVSPVQKPGKHGANILFLTMTGVQAFITPLHQ